MICDIGYCSQNSAESWTFRASDEDRRYSRLVYASPYANAANNIVWYSGIIVEK